MTFSEKLLRLRRQAGFSQEELADKLQVSRQAISRWELGTAMPDAPNLLALGRIFAVSTDYLLRDEWESDKYAEPPAAKPALTAEQKRNNRAAALALLMALSAMATLVGLLGCMVLQNNIVVLMGLMLHVAIAGGFEVSFRRSGGADAEAQAYRRKFYRCFIWFAALFPVLALVREYGWLIFRSPFDVWDELLVAGVAYLLICGITCGLLREEHGQQER